MFGWIIQISTDRANILAGIFFLGEIYLCQHRRYGIVQIHHTLGLQVLIALWRMGLGGKVSKFLTIFLLFK